MNDQRVEGATHAQVVSLIRQGGESLKLTVNNLDEFCFRWWENSIIEIGKPASFPLIFYHLKWSPKIDY